MIARTHRRDSRRGTTGPMAMGLATVAFLPILFTSPRSASAAAETARTVEIYCSGPQRTCAALQAAASPLLPASGAVTFRIEVSATPPVPTPGDVGRGEASRIYIAAADRGPIAIATLRSGGPPEVRTIDSDTPGPVTAEMVAQIVGQTVQVLLAEVDTEETEPPPVEVALSSSPPVPAAPQSPPPGDLTLRPERPMGVASPLPDFSPFQLTFGYVSRVMLSGDGLGGSGPRQHGGFAQFSAFLSAARLRPLLSATLELSQLNEGVTDSLTRVGWRVLGGVSWQPDAPFYFSGALGFGADHFSNDENGDAVPAARGLLSVSAFLPGQSFISRMLLSAGFILDLMPRHQSFKILSIFTKRVQPGVFAGLGWRF